MENLKPSHPLILNASDCKLKEIKELEKIEATVKELNLAINYIEKLDGIPKTIEKLDASSNLLTNFEGILSMPILL